MNLNAKKALFWRIILAFIVTLSISSEAMTATHEPTVERGVLDLTGWDFHQKGTLEIAGEWEFYWQEFLSPEEFPTNSDNPTYLTVPGTWLDHPHQSGKLGKYGYATYRLKILLPEDTPPLALYLKRVQDAYKLYVNGELWMQAGNPARISPEHEAHITQEYSSLKGLSGELELVFHIANHSSYAGGGFFNSFTIGVEKDQHFQYILDLAQDFLLTGALVFLGIFMVALHIGRTRERAYFVLYVMSFAAAVYIVMSHATLIKILPTLPYHWVERTAYISGAFLIALIYEFVHQINPRKTSAVLSNIIMYQAAVISILVIFWPKGLPVELIYGLGLHLLVVAISCAIEVRYVLTTKVPGRWLITLGLTFLVGAGANDLLNAIGLIMSVYLAPYSILLLLCFYAALLASRVNTTITQNEQLAKAIWSMDEGVAIFDNRDRIVLWNEAYSTHLSSKAREMLRPGLFFKDLVKADAYSGELQNATGKEQKYIQERIKRHRFPGEPFEIERDSGWYLYREAETPDGGRVTLAADLSQQKTKEAELQKAFKEVVAANEAKNNFLSNMSHELRTPLNAINGFSEMMANEVFGPLNDQYSEYIGHVQRASKHLLRLVTDMLDIARIETGKFRIVPEEFQLSDLLEDCIRMEAEKMEVKKLVFEKDISKTLPHLYADPVRVRQIILNLMDNAIKFTKEGDTITLGASVSENGTTSIYVKDTGIGIAKENIETALRQFGQIRSSHLNTHEGLGLGLSLAQILTQLQGGKLTLESEVNMGTCVTVTFPAKEDAKALFEHPHAAQ